MEVLVGSTFSIDVSSPPAYARDHGEGGGGAQDEAHDGIASLRRFIKEDNETRKLNGLGLGNGKSVDDSSDSSSIGAESEDEDNDDDVVSSEKALCSLTSLEESLPIKKGLSNYYSGKSRSFADLSQLDSISSAKDLRKPENPLNKRRRIQMANKWSCSSRRSSSSLYTFQNSISVPLLPLNEEDSVVDEAEGPKQQTQEVEGISQKKGNPWLKSESCFEISDLEEEEEEED
ncbi:hypothetical protein HS088_TW04G00036 [Tripterygium wilfordii]|uniref:Uncharacterized protein n=1 Tax=Tripterygium wilfordii TaxID=458696 RepID=A0A7J7DP53_TRIWF|nr:uncharacterized protein LOC119996363 [Tripterygium wilfordii]KAF5748087.1 hypothetical protein HS088_TW04G00036 [Tripterygium wilfordii]